MNRNKGAIPKETGTKPTIPKTGSKGAGKGAVPKTTKEQPFQRSQKTVRTPPQASNQNVSIYLCQICLAEDDLEKVRCDKCLLWYHFTCANSEVVNQDVWMCSQCNRAPSASEARVDRGQLVTVEDLVENKEENPSGCSKLPPYTDQVFDSQPTTKYSFASSKLPPSADQVFENQPAINNSSDSSKLPHNMDQVFESQQMTDKSNISHRSSSVKSSVSRRAALALLKLEEERQMLAQRDSEALQRQRERDNRYLSQKYSILQEDAMSNSSFKCEEFDLQKVESIQQWADSIQRHNYPSACNVTKEIRNTEVFPSSMPQSTSQSCQRTRNISDYVHNCTSAQTAVNYHVYTLHNWSKNPPISRSTMYQRNSLGQPMHKADCYGQTVPRRIHPAVPKAFSTSTITSNASNMPSVTLADEPYTSSIQTSLSNSKQRSEMSSNIPVVTSNVQLVAHLNALTQQRSGYDPQNQLVTPTYESTSYQPVGYNYQSSHQPFFEKRSYQPVIKVPVGAQSFTLSQPLDGCITVTSGHQQRPRMNNHNFTPNNQTQSLATSQPQPFGTSQRITYQSFGGQAQTFDTNQSQVFLTSPGQPLRTRQSQPFGMNQPIIQRIVQPSNTSGPMFSGQYQPALSNATGPAFNHQQQQPLINMSGGLAFGSQQQPPLVSMNCPSFNQQQPSSIVGQSYNNVSMMNQSTMAHGGLANISIPSRLTAEQIASRHVMPKDLPHFYGDPIEWQGFISAYENSTGTCGYNNSENLGRLQKCLKGDAAKAVQSRLLHPDSVPGIIDTLRLLYGRPEVIIETTIQNIQKTPPPNDDDLASLIKFAISIRNLSDTIQHTGASEHLRNPMLINTITDKLPAHFKLQWAFHKQTIGIVNIGHLGDWLYQLAEAASQVVRKPSHKRDKPYLNAHCESWSSSLESESTNESSNESSSESSYRASYDQNSYYHSSSDNQAGSKDQSCDDQSFSESDDELQSGHSSDNSLESNKSLNGSGQSVYEGSNHSESDYEGFDSSESMPLNKDNGVKQDLMEPVNKGDNVAQRCMSGNTESSCLMSNEE